MRLVLIDGECSFCQTSVQFIMKRDGGTFHFASLQSDFGRQFVEKYCLQEIDSVVYIENGKAYIYSDAVLRIVRYLQWPWRILVIGRIIPRPLRDLIYRFIAKNRHYLLKNKTVCAIPSEKDRARFLA